MIHPSAIVDSQDIGEGTMIFAFTHVLDGASIGRNVKLCDHVFVEGGAVIGNNVTIKNNVSIWTGVTIEEDVFIGPNVAFTNDLNPRSPRMERAKKRYERLETWLQPTRVCRGATLGANATLVPGITIGAFAFVAAGAVVTKDVAPFALVAGNPARPKSSVCSCGQKLIGCFREATCEHCGETPESRLAVMGEPTTQPKT